MISSRNHGNRRAAVSKRWCMDYCLCRASSGLNCSAPFRSAPTAPPLRYTTLRLPLELVFNLLQVVGAVNLDDLVDLGRVAHQFLGARVQHLDLGVAGDGQVVEHDVGHREAAGVLGGEGQTSQHAWFGGSSCGAYASIHVHRCMGMGMGVCVDKSMGNRDVYQGERVAQEHETRGMLGQLVGDALHVRVDVVV